ncbi:MAG TPA: acetylornithine transaminase [Spongiibacteraceae bacterium]|nr:acetylornithine transaminase [Spongiibacteraceae bacterium]
MNTYCDALMEVTERPPVTMVSGSGSWLVDHNGKRYLDFVQGWAVNCLGHAPEIVAQAAAAQARKLVSCSPAYYNEPMLNLATLIAELSGLDKVFFANSGAEANEGAIKLARKYGEKYRNGAFEIITLEHSFHGRTLAAMSASGKAAWQDLFAPKLPGFKKVPINDIEAMRNAIGPNTVGVMLEPIQGEAGVIPASREYMHTLRQLTRERGVLLILDEIQTGIGRTGSLFAYQRLGIDPDIVTLGKGLGGGVPLAALLAKREVSCFDHGDQGGTFSGNPLTTAVGYAVLSEVAKPEFLKNIEHTGNYLHERLQQLSQRFDLGEVRGDGLLLALDIPQGNANQIAAAVFANGLLVNAVRPHILRFMPALNVSVEEIDSMADLIGEQCRTH